METTRQSQAPERSAARRPVMPGRQPDDAPRGEFRPDRLALATRQSAPLPNALWQLASSRRHEEILGLQRAVGNAAVQRLLAQRKAATPSIEVRAGAKPSYRLRRNDYGGTTPERVAVEIIARLNQKTGAWSPKITRLTGHYAMQTRLLPGQSEITGPGGNTTKKNFCSQAVNLSVLGTSSSKWYMIKAVIEHEKIHAMRMLPALKDAAPAITARIEKVKIRHDGKMTQAQAIAKLKGDAVFKSSVAHARKLWLAALKSRSAGDHASGGPTDQAEQKVTDPMRKKICGHAKKMKWGACPACR